VKIYRINKRTHKLELVDILRCPRESGPRIIRFSADGKFAYLLFELSNEIKVYSYDGSGKNPEFELLQSISTLEKNDKDAIHNAASGLALAPDGKHLFCTTAGENTVSMYEVDTETGLLTKKFTLPISGDYPKDLVIFPDNMHIAIANHASNTITVFAVDYEKNTIAMNQKPRQVETPNSIHIWEIPEDDE
jgi:6-phosphogluconolactonase